MGRSLHFISRLFLLTVLLVAPVFLPACAPEKSTQPPVLPTITIGTDGTAVNTLIYIADSQKYFTANGIQVVIKTYPSGMAAVEGMLKNEVDVATASEFVLVSKAFVGAPLVAWASIDKFMHNYLIARTDRGIHSVKDLHGKKIGLPLKTVAEFYLGRFLELHNLQMSDVTIVNTSPNDLVNALVNGSVDAVVAWQPNAKTLEDRLGSSAILWPAQNDQVSYAILLSTAQWTNDHAQSVSQFLRALVQAETFYAGHPAEARALLQKRLNLNDASIAVIWPEHQFAVSLEQSMILAMEDEARWMIHNQTVQEPEPPAFVNNIYIEGMHSVRPDAVNIIH